MKVIATKDPRIHPQFKDLITLPIIVRVNKINEAAVATFAKEFEAAHNTGQPVIPVVIDSYGGEVYSLLSMIAIIENANLPVATIGMGKSMSCGSVLLTCGTDGYRFMDADSTVMIHDVSSGAIGKVEDMKARIGEAERLGKLIFQKMAKNCGHRNENYFIKLIEKKKHVDWYLTAKEAKKHSIVDHIGVPEFIVDVSVDMEFKF